MYLPKELWQVIKDYVFEPYWKRIGKETFIKKINYFSNFNYGYNSNERYLFKTWSFLKRVFFLQNYIKEWKFNKKI